MKAIRLALFVYPPVTIADREEAMTISVADYARDCAAQGLRGDYSVCRSDFTVSQDYDYSADEQAVWRTLCDRQTRLTRRLAHHSYLDGIDALDLLDRIPDFDEV